MKKITALFWVGILMIVCAGCGEHVIVNGISYRALSSEEQKAMLAFARMTIINGEKLTAAEQNYVRTVQPTVRLSYTGDKVGRASYEWIIADDVIVRLNCEGEFLSDNMRLNTRKIKLHEDKLKGQKNSLEKLTFKDINVDKN